MIDEKILTLKTSINSFNDADFGEPIYSPKPEQMPEIVPPAGKHPRLGFTAERLKNICKNVEKGDNKYAYAEVMRLSEIECDGRLRDFTNHDVINNVRTINSEIHNIILAKAFRYAAAGEKLYGYQAIFALKNYLSDCDKHLDTSYEIDYHISLTMTEAMSVIALVYDWCYPLLSDRDKKQLVGAATSKCASLLEFPDYPPKKGGGVCGHQSGPPILTGWVPFVLAVYDEYPEYYNIIFDLMLHVVVPGQNYVVKAGFHGQGVAYGASRLSSLLKAECYFSYMFDNKQHLFSDKVGDACVSFLKTIRPDGETLRIGDDFLQGLRFSHIIICSLLGAGLYSNPVLKGFAAHQTDNFSLFWLHGLNPIDVLLFNDASLERAELDSLPLVTYYDSPSGIILAKTAHNDKNAGMVYMKIGETGSSNHEHKDCGDFQIYHKGMLISSSGCYAGYGCEHDFAYYKQTISKNSILVYNPNMKDNGKWIYSGGQRIDEAANEGIATLDEWRQNPNFNRAKILYGGYKTKRDEKDREEYCYSYIAGDLTRAYDKETVSEVKRYMFSLNTENRVNPMIFILFDRITAKDKNYKKTLLFHTLSEPLITEVSGRPCSVVTNLKSRLYIQSLLTEVNHTFVGGKDKECIINGKNCPFEFPGRIEGIKSRYNTETGIGRIEISPKAPAEENSFLTVMYIGPDTDCSPYLKTNFNVLQPFQKAVLIKGDNAVGAAILGYAVIFPEDGEEINKNSSIRLPEDIKIKTAFINGLKAGKWNINGKEYIVNKKEGIAEVKIKTEKVINLSYIK